MTSIISALPYKIYMVNLFASPFPSGEHKVLLLIIWSRVSMHLVNDASVLALERDHLLTALPPSQLFDDSLWIYYCKCSISFTSMLFIFILDVDYTVADVCASWYNSIHFQAVSQKGPNSR